MSIISIDVSLANSSTDPTATDAPSSFALQGNQLGALENSVNLFTGEVSFPLNLISLPGKNGLDVNVTMAYNSLVSAQMETRNMEAPTSTLGLGWQMSIPKIVCDHKQTGTREDDDFYLVEGGVSTKLIKTGDSGGVWTFEAENYKFWKITFDASTGNKWEIVRENGVTFTYGVNEAAIEEIVKFGNWIGDTGPVFNQSHLAVAWNLSETRNHLGDAVNYYYSETEGSLDDDDDHHMYTQAVYLSRIVDTYGREVNFYYSSKISNEYQDPHTEASEPDAYQERYETQYLASVEVTNQNNAMLFTVVPEYDFIGTGDFTKRILTTLSHIGPGGEDFPPMEFEYLTSGERKGSLYKVYTSQGGEVSFTYRSSAKYIGNSQKNITAIAPSGYTQPQVLTGHNYVVILWRNTSNNDVKAQVYEWDGEWEKHELGSIGTYTIQSYSYYPMKVKLEKDFFVISRSLSPFLEANVYAFHRDGKGGWSSFSKKLSIDPSGSFLSRRVPSLISGEEFFAIGEYLEGDLNIFTWDGESWRAQTKDMQNGHYTYTGTNNYIWVHDKNGSNLDNLTFYYLNAKKEWVAKAVPSSVEFHSVDITEWYASNGFVVGMIPDDGFGELIYMWDENYENFTRTSLGQHWDDAPVFVLNNHTVAIAPKSGGYTYSKIARYTGNEWKMTSNLYCYQNGIGNNFSFSPDFFIYPEKDSQDVRYYDYNPNAYGWSATELPFESDETHAGYNLFFTKNKFYVRNEIGVWSEKASLSFEPQSAHFHMGPFYAAYEEGNIAKVKIFRNGQEAATHSISGDLFKGTMSGGVNSMQVSYAHGDVIYSHSGSYQESSSYIYLYKIIGEELSGKFKHYPVTKVTVNDGVQDRYTSYDYETSTGSADISGQVAQYHKVKTVPGSSSAFTTPYGYTWTYFINGETEAEVSDDYPVYGYSNRYKLLTGVPYRTEVYNSSGELKSESTQAWRINKKDISNDNGNVVATAYYAEVSSTSNKTYVNGHTMSNATYYTYFTETGQLKKTSAYNSNEDGEQELLETTYKYWWEAYDTDRSENLLTPVIQSKKFNNGKVIASSVTTWKEWGYKGFAPWRSYTWKAEDETSHNFSSWNSTYTGNDWVLTSDIVSRNSDHQAIEAKDADGMYSASYYDNATGLPLATATNARSGDLFVETFDDLPSSAKWTVTGLNWETTSFGTLKWSDAGNPARITSGFFSYNDNYILEFDWRVPNEVSNENHYMGVRLNVNWSTDSESQSGVTLRFQQDAGDLLVYLTNTSGATIGSQVRLDDMAEKLADWAHVRVVKEGSALLAYLDGEKVYELSGQVMSSGYCYGMSTSGMLSEFDNFRFYPSDAYLTSYLYDPVYYNLIGSIGPDGLRNRTLMDENFRNVATVNAKGIVAQTKAAYSSIEFNGAYLSTDPNVVHTTTVRGLQGGYDDFESPQGYSGLDKWTEVERANSVSSSWNISEGKLHFQSSGRATSSSTDTYYMEFDEELTGRVGIELDMKAEVLGSGRNLGIALGGAGWIASGAPNSQTENAIWTNFYGSNWTVYTDSWQTITNGILEGKTYRLKILVDLDVQKADYYINGKLFLSDVPFRGSVSSLAGIGLFNYGMGSAAERWIDNLVVYADPLQSSVFADASGKILQSQSETDRGKVSISETMYDTLGRAVVSTKPTEVNQKFGFDQDFITSFSWSSGYMYGTVKDLNADGYFPYSRTVYNDYPGAEPIETSLPGTTYTLGSGRNGSVEYMTNADFDMGMDLLANQYLVVKSTNPDGAEHYIMTDKAGRKVREMAGPVTGDVAMPVYSEERLDVGETSSFVMPYTQEVSYYMSPLIISGATKTLHIGTTPGGNDVVSYSTKYPNGQERTFTAQAGVTYYVTVSTTLPEPEPDPDPIPDPDPCTAQYSFEADGSVQVLEPCLQKQALSVEETSMQTSTASSTELSSENYDGPEDVMIRYISDYEIRTETHYLTTGYEYDDAGNLTAIYPPNYFHSPDATANREDYVSRMKYDGLGRLKESTSPDEGTTRFIYDQQGRIKFMQDARGKQEGYLYYYEYNYWGELTEEGYMEMPWDEEALQSYADGENTTGGLARIIDGMILTGTQTFDEASIIVSNTTVQPGANVTLLADEEITLSPGTEIIAGSIFTATVNKSPQNAKRIWKKKYHHGEWEDQLVERGTLWKVEVNNDEIADAEITERYVFNRFGAVTNKYVEAGDFEQGETGLAYTFDNMGSVTSIDYGTDLVVKYTHDIAGRLKSVGTPQDEDLFAAYEYGLNGQITTEKLNGQSVARNYTYNSEGRLTRIDDPYFREELYFETRSNATNGYYSGMIAEAAFTFKTGHYFAGENYNVSYTYDKLDRLLKADNSANSAWDLGVGSQLSYDANGNILSLQRGTDAVKSYTYYQGTNRVKNTDGSGSVDYSYDALGNVIASIPKNLSAIAYDKYFNLTTRTENTVENLQTEFQYGAAEQRVLKREYEAGSLKNTLFYIHGLNDYPLLERIKLPDGSESYVEYVYGPSGQIASRQVNGNWRYPLKDHLGSTRVVVGELEGVVATFDYMPFGGIMRSYESGENVRYQYTGQEMDVSTGLHNYRARMYDSDLGRFYAADPMGYMHIDMSPYVAMGNNPIIYVDPDGKLFWVPIAIGAAIGGLVNLGIEAYRGNINSFWDGFAAFGIGAMAGAASVMAPQLIGTLGGIGLTTASGAIAGGFVPGAVAGAAGGFVGSFGSSLYFGYNKENSIIGNIGNSLVNGLIGGAIGGLAGGLIGGTINAIRGKPFLGEKASDLSHYFKVREPKGSKYKHRWRNVNDPGLKTKTVSITREASEGIFEQIDLEVIDITKEGSKSTNFLIRDKPSSDVWSWITRGGGGSSNKSNSGLEYFVRGGTRQKGFVWSYYPNPKSIPHPTISFGFNGMKTPTGRMYTQWYYKFRFFKL